MNAESVLEQVLLTLRILIPELILLAAAIAMITAAPFVKLPRRRWCAIAAGAMVISLLSLLLIGSTQTDMHVAAAVNDDLGYYGCLVVLLSGLVLLGLANEEPTDDRAGEFFGALLIINAGAMLVTTANDLVFLFVGLEMVSIPTYLLLYLTRRDITTQESATKYFYLSIFASGLLLYGMAFLYGLTGASNLKAITALSLSLPSIPNPNLALIAVIFIMAGLCFRVAAVPFHFYAPDVYQGSPTVIAALLSWIPKGIGFVAIVRMLTAIISVDGTDDLLVQKVTWIAWIIAAATMTLGNTVALLQTDLKRLLAYSSISHAGYLMIGVTAAFAQDNRPATFYYGSEAIFFYLTVYALMTLGAFGVIIALRIAGKPAETIDDLSGLAAVQPGLALAMAICLLSLSGIPPLAGFWGKLQIFSAALAASPEGASGSFLMLVVIGALNAAAGAYYYLRIIVLMYFRPAPSRVSVEGGWPLALSIAVCASLLVLVGIYPAPVARAARASAEAAATFQLQLRTAQNPPVAQRFSIHVPEVQP